VRLIATTPPSRRSPAAPCYRGGQAVFQLTLVDELQQPAPADAPAARVRREALLDGGPAESSLQALGGAVEIDQNRLLELALEIARHSFLPPRLLLDLIELRAQTAFDDAGIFDQRRLADALEIRGPAIHGDGAAVAPAEIVTML
jgi:hypothetical protein